MRLDLPILLMLTIYSSELLSIESNEELIAFVGEKISVVQVDIDRNKNCGKNRDCIVISMDQKFQASYKIIEMIHGEFSESIIDFEVFDHYGEPAFSAHKYVLLFVSKYENRLVHQKYQYFDVYLTE